MENNNKNKLIKSLVILVILIVVLVGVSFAYFTMTANNAGVVGGQVVPSLPIELVDDGRIQATNLLPILATEINSLAETVNFSVVSTNPLHPINYSISLIEMQITPNLRSNHFRWDIINRDNSNVVASGNFNAANPPRIDLSSNIRVERNVVTTHNYTFRLWIETDGVTPLNELMNGEFSAKLAITAYMVYEN